MLQIGAVSHAHHEINAPGIMMGVISDGTRENGTIWHHDHLVVWSFQRGGENLN